MGADPLVHQPLRPRRVVHDGRDQLHHDDHQHGGAGHDALPYAGRGLVALQHGDPAPARAASPNVGRRDAPLRPHAGDELVQAVGRRRAAPLAAPLLVLRASGGLYPHPARDGHRLGDPPGLLPQAHLRLPRHGLLDDLHRVPVVGRLRPPHVRERHEPGARDGLHRDHDDHRRAVGHQDLQLARHALGRPDPVHRADAQRARVRLDVRHRRALGHLHGLDAGRHLHPGHVLHRRAHPLRRLRRLDLRRVRRDLLLVPEDVRPHDEHRARPPALLADVRVLQPDLLPDAHHRGRRPDAAHLQPDAVRVPPAPATLERIHHLQRAAPRHLPDPVRRQLFLVLVRGQEGAVEPLELEHARVDGGVAPAAPELGRDLADGVSRPLRVQLTGVAGRFLAAIHAPRRGGRSAATLIEGRPVAYRLALATLAATCVLILLGGLVTNTGAALAVPDWPSTFGHNMVLFPWSRMVGGILYEHSHRLMGALVGLLTLALAGALWREGGRLRRLGLLAVAAVVAQGVLGGLRVVLLEDTLAIFHGCLAQAFFALLAVIALLTAPRGRVAASPIEPAP